MTQTRILHSRAGLDARGSRGPVAITIADGVIAAVEDADRPNLPDTIAMPALVNAHDHARPMRNSSVGGFGKPLEIWLHRLALLAPVDRLSRRAGAAWPGRAGRPGGRHGPLRAPAGPDRPADGGRGGRARRPRRRRPHRLRRRHARPEPAGLRPGRPGAGGARTRGRRRDRARVSWRRCTPFADQLAMVDAVAAAVQGPMVDVQYAPNGPQWVTEPSWRRRSPRPRH